MKIELKDFQEDAVHRLLTDVRHARREVEEDGKGQAIILSSPTGSGKTVTVTALLERILQGDEGDDPDPQGVFLWLSDSPELNVQSRDKILTQSSAFREHELVVIEPPFNQERLEPGLVYFLNTQKLGKDNLLTKHGDGREYTIWQTIENTARVAASHFYLVIDEAHRGMNLAARQMQQAETLVQKFIFGDPEVGLSPVKIILGMSATPARFARIIEGSDRTKRDCSVKPADVRASGLLKDRIVLYSPKKEQKDQPSDWTMLSEAAKRWRHFSGDWKRYCGEQGIPPVEPVLVVQVEDAREGSPTRTNLTQAVEILEREGGQFGLSALAHCFETDGPIEAGGREIRKIEPSKIQFDPLVKVVFFKMALSTGWDCPRAEVMMSFRRAADHTSIAQLVGRMVRTPLARRIEGNELLNTVSLHLPHYDDAGLRAIVDKLNDPENAPPTEVVEGADLVTVKRDPAHKALFEALATIPSYSVERAPRTTNTKRFVRLARQLTFDEIDPRSLTEARGLVVRTLKEELDRLRQNPLFARQYKANERIEIREVRIEAGEWKQGGAERTIRVKATPENIDDLFDECGRLLGEGLHKAFWKAMRDDRDPQRPKLELHGVIHDQAAWKRLEDVAGKRLAALWDEHKDRVRGLPTSKQEEYNRIRRQAKEPQTVPLMFPEAFDVRREEAALPHHLYVDDAGNFGWKGDGWEAAVLQCEMENGGLVGWLRNFPRKPWSVCIPYRHGGDDRPLYPDLIVFRREKGRIRVDLLDPHNPELVDAVDKAHGLARYAERHGDFFGRIELIALDKNGQIKRLDVNKEVVREKVNAVRDTAYLKSLFEG